MGSHRGLGRTNTDRHWKASVKELVADVGMGTEIAANITLQLQLFTHLLNVPGVMKLQIASLPGTRTSQSSSL